VSSDRSSYRQILRATSVIGGATAGSILIGLVRMKVFAMMIGPAGIGLLGLLAAIQTTATAVAGMGTASSGVRYLTVDTTDPEREQDARWTFWALTLLLAALGMVGVWLFRLPIAQLASGRIDDAGAIGWLSVSVALSVIAGAHLSVLQAHRQIADIARVQIGGALLGAVGGIVVVMAAGSAGIVPALIMVPLGTVVVAMAFGRGVPGIRLLRRVPSSLQSGWRLLLSLGVAMMVSNLIGMAVQIAVRALVVRDLGLDAAGLYQAGWTISVTNIGLVLTAMSADYFPRLSAVARDPLREGDMVNQQLHVGLLICAPLIVGMTALAPLALHVLYSSRFEAAADFLRWQLLGDIFKMGGWALGFVMVARNDKIVFMLVEASFAVVYLAVTMICTAAAGLEVVGVAYALAYAVYFSISAMVCIKRYRIVLDRGNIVWMAALATTCATLIVLGHLSWVLVAVPGVMAAAGIALVSVYRLAALSNESGAISPAQRLARNVAARLRGFPSRR